MSDTKLPATCPFCGAAEDPAICLPKRHLGEVTAYTCKTIHCPEWTRTSGMQTADCVEAEVAKLTAERDKEIGRADHIDVYNVNLEVGIRRLTEQLHAAREDASQFHDEAAALKVRIKQLETDISHLASNENIVSAVLKWAAANGRRLSKADLERMGAGVDAMVEENARLTEERDEANNARNVIAKNIRGEMILKMQKVAKERDEALAEVARLKAGGCARDQRTTQFCAEAAELQERVKRLEEAVTAYQKAYTPDGHSFPRDCFATGPFTGDPIQDIIACPGCWAEQKAKEAKP